MPLGKHVVIGAGFVSLLAGAGTAVAGTGVGGVFNLGQTNAVNAESRLTGTTATPLLRVQNDGTAPAAFGIVARNRGVGNTIKATNDGGGTGVRADSETGTGVAGLHTSTTGTAPGVLGTSASRAPETAGVIGTLTSVPGTSSAGVRGEVLNADTPKGAGVHGRHAGNGFGLFAESLGTSGAGAYTVGGALGLYARGKAPGATGVFGASASGTGVTYGVRGEAASVDGAAGYFQNMAAGLYGTGVVGLASDTFSSGAPVGYFAAGGEFTGANGVIGAADRASGYGVFGVQGAGQYAGFFAGAVHVNGTLSKSAGSFKIDHPQDPANKTLSHSFVESPDMKNVYDGTVTLDGAGKAVVVLPGYFEALNRDPRYLLTPIGGAAPDLHVATKVRGNRFSIAGGTPGLEVSWQVTGIRQDAYANAHRIPVEEDKLAADRGSYLNPAAFGRGASASAGTQAEGAGRPAATRPVPAGDPPPRRP